LHHAVVEIETANPGLIIRALGPDETQSPKFRADLKAAKGKVVLTVEAAELGGLTAGLSSWLRLIRTAEEANGLE